MKFKITLLLLALSAMALCQKTTTNLRLPSLISDNMVLQQKTAVKIWGKANPGKNIKIVTSWKAEGKATANGNGLWGVMLQTPEAGGPYEITISAKDTVVKIKNVLIGEVWFCSGQSNMEMPMEGWLPQCPVKNSTKEIATANFPNIRLFNVQRKISSEPLDECNGKWQECNSASLPSFSATAYFFGKELYKRIHVPIALIESAWGGTPSEAWTSYDALKKTGEFSQTLDEVKNYTTGEVDKFNNWIKEHRQVVVDQKAEADKWKNLNFQDETCSSPDFEDNTWPSMKLPQAWEGTKVGDFDGIIWFRKSIDVPEQLVGKDLILSLGPIDDMDRVYFNGKLVGATELEGMWQVERNYAIPSGLVKPGKNTIAVRVMDIQGGGGIDGHAGQMKLGIKGDNTSVSVPLSGDWKYMPAAELLGNVFYMYDIAKGEFFLKARPKVLNPSLPTVLYNGMVTPFLPYKIKGVIWYQGEANVGRAAQYAKIFPAMIENWRAAWAIKDMPFYFVQIAPWIYSGKEFSESCELKEAQAEALKLPNTGMVVTSDIGTVDNIHPPFKQDVGLRLANLALAKNYGVSVHFSGPIYKSMRVEKNKIILQFSHIEGGLVSKNGELKEFEIAGREGKYFPATAKIAGNEVVVISSQVTNPVSVRYCWHNGSEASLFNKAGLPASLFRTKK